MRQEGQGTLELLLLLMGLAIAVGLLMTYVTTIGHTNNEPADNVIYAPPMPENELENNDETNDNGIEMECTPSDVTNCGPGIGICTGSQICADGTWSECNAPSPADEICDDDLDNDCDGQIDEGCVCNTGEEKDCGSDTGECVKGKQTCENGIWGDCIGVIGPADESCDNLDNDCDGLIDEECSCSTGEKKDCGSDVGECAKGTQTCGDGIWGSCVGNITPAAEICDNLDNDCDGDADEGCECETGEEKDCGSDNGECAKGKQICGNGIWGNCVGAIGPATEICDNLDNDCDWQTDEDCLCKTGEKKDCGSDVGECAKGKQTCENGTWGNCVGNTNPAAEICDNLDNDCDGTADESLTKQCGSNVGICKYGTSTCSKGAWGNCIGGVNPAVEICDDGKDNDCDGSTDEECTENPENNLAVVWFSNAMKKILKTQAAEKSNIAKISAAKNEYESFQIVVTSKISNSGNFKVSISNFGGPGTIDKSKIQMYRIEYVDVKRWISWGANGPEVNGENDPSIFMPDPLVPITESENVNLPAKQSKPIWFRVEIPKNVPAGTYYAMAEISSGGLKLTKKIELEVYDFTLPDEFGMQSLFDLGGIGYHFSSTPFTSAGEQKYNNMVEKYYEEFKIARLNPFLYSDAFSPMVKNRGSYWDKQKINFTVQNNVLTNIDYSLFDPVAQKHLSGSNKFNTFVFLRRPQGIENGDFSGGAPLTDKDEWISMFSQLKAHLQSKGWYDEAIYYLVDEISKSKIGDTGWVTNTMQKVSWIKDGAPDLPIAISIAGGSWCELACYESKLDSYCQGVLNNKGMTYAEFTKDTFDNYVFPLNPDTGNKKINIWIPNINRLNSYTGTSLQARQNLGEDIWLYDVSTLYSITKNANYIKWYSLKGKEGVANRVTPWILWKIGGKGLLYYYVNYYHCSGSTCNNPWKTPTNVGSDGTTIIDGQASFFYPPCGENLPAGSIKCSSDNDTIVPSIRWELLREGIEDYEYFKMLQNKINQHGGSDQGTAALNYAMNLISYCYYDFDGDASKYYAARKQIAEAIEALS